MAATDKRATRHEPESVTITLPDGSDHEFLVKPIPWRKRNDLGEIVVQMYTASLSKLIDLSNTEEGALAAGNSMLESGFDYPALFEIGYSTYDVENGEIIVKSGPPVTDKRAFILADFEGMVEVCSAILRANGLDRLEHLIDPDRKKGPLTGENAAVTVVSEAVDGQKTE